MNMKVLTTSATAQTFKVIPREYVTSATMLVRDDSTNVTTTYTGLTPSISVNHLQVSNTFSPVLVEGRHYDLTIKKTDGTIIYKDKAFCTDQAIDQTQDQEYTVNSGEYKSDTSFDNDFIII
tara:strand:- start:2370 stop:2735 length:366 start_codon:yes stop_codon:yes gene_type:complete